MSASSSIVPTLLLSPTRDKPHQCPTTFMDVAVATGSISSLAPAKPWLPPTATQAIIFHPYSPALVCTPPSLAITAHFLVCKSPISVPVLICTTLLTVLSSAPASTLILHMWLMQVLLQDATEFLSTHLPRPPPHPDPNTDTSYSDLQIQQFAKQSIQEAIIHCHPTPSSFLPSIRHVWFMTVLHQDATEFCHAHLPRPPPLPDPISTASLLPPAILSEGAMT
jgi:hypothetical protein